MTTFATAAEVNDAIAHFGNYRTLRSQQLAYGMNFHASVLMALGLRETGLKNICGGAKWEDGHWVQSFLDRGCFQISEQVADEREWLASVPGCENGHWGPADPPVAALTPMHVPRFTDAAIYAIGKAELNRKQALKAAVDPNAVLRFCVAAHNAGFQGALNGYREGDVDKHTAHGDYSAWVMAAADLIHQWVVDPIHSGWRYKPTAVPPPAKGEEAF